jgi:hypothetical protein
MPRSASRAVMTDSVTASPVHPHWPARTPLLSSACCSRTDAESEFRCTFFVQAPQRAAAAAAATMEVPEETLEQLQTVKV